MYRNDIQAVAFESGWSRETHQITDVFRRFGVAITVEYASAATGYESYNFARRRDDNGSIHTASPFTLKSWLQSVAVSNEPQYIEGN